MDGLGVRHIASESDVAQLTSLLLDPRRTQPVVVVSTRQGETETWIEADRIAQEVGDFAQVWVVPTGALSWRLADALPSMTQVYGGAGRVYPATPTWQTDPHSSPLRFVLRREAASDVTDTLISDAMSFALASGIMAGPKPTRRAAVRASGVVKGHVTQRAMVELDSGVWVTISSELTVAGVQIGDLVRAGQKVEGIVDQRAKRLDVRTSLIPADQALATYQPGDVILARVVRTHVGSITVSPYPGIELKLTAEETGATGELTDLFSPGEVVSVRLVELDPLTLRMDDVTSTDSPRTAPSLLPGGPPWINPPPPPEPPPPPPTPKLPADAVPPLPGAGAPGGVGGGAQQVAARRVGPSPRELSARMAARKAGVPYTPPPPPPPPDAAQPGGAGAAGVADGVPGVGGATGVPGTPGVPGPGGVPGPSGIPGGAVAGAGDAPSAPKPGPRPGPRRAGRPAGAPAPLPPPGVPQIPGAVPGKADAAGQPTPAAVQPPTPGAGLPGVPGQAGQPAPGPAQAPVPGAWLASVPGQAPAAEVGATAVGEPTPAQESPAPQAVQPAAKPGPVPTPPPGARVARPRPGPGQDGESPPTRPAGAGPFTIGEASGLTLVEVENLVGAYKNRAEVAEGREARAHEQVEGLRREFARLSEEFDQVAARGNATERQVERLRTMLRHAREQSRGLRDAVHNQPAASPASIWEQVADKFADPVDQLRWEISLAWALHILPDEKDTYPLPEYDVGPNFLASLEKLQGIPREKVLTVIVEVLVKRAKDSHGRTMHRLRSSSAGGSPTRKRDDGAVAMRVALQRGAPAARQLHFWRKQGGRIELDQVGVHDEGLL